MGFSDSVTFQIRAYNSPMRPFGLVQSWEVRSLFQSLFVPESGQVSEAKPLAVFAIQGTGFGFICGLFRVFAQPLSD